ncbi:transposase, MuDR, MULE transposase domain protein [Tanacetum coccineum]
MAVRLKALSEGFQFVTDRSAPERCYLKCYHFNECDWYLRATLWDHTKKYYITYLNDVHTCSKTQTYPNHRNANKKVIGHLLTPKLQDRSRVLRGKDIQQDILSEYKIHISYQQAMKGKHYGIQQKKNKGTVTRIKTDDAAHLKGLYKGTNLVAVAMDGNNQIVPIAFGICKGETGPCWSWWMSVLKECIGDNPNLLFISDRHAAIALAVEKEFPLAFHAPDAHEKLCRAGPQRWSRAHCPLVRYNYMTSNSVESVNACSVIYRKEPVLKLAETYRAMVQEWYYKRRQLADWFKKPKYQATYSESIHSFGNMQQWKFLENIQKAIPPRMDNPQPGRPKIQTVYNLKERSQELYVVLDAHKRDTYVINAVLLHHYGRFTSPPHREFVDELIATIDPVDIDTFSANQVKLILTNYVGYDKNSPTFLYIKKRNCSLDSGLVPFEDAIQERDTILMYTHHNSLHVYVSRVELSPLVVAELFRDETNKRENQGKPSCAKKLFD